MSRCFPFPPPGYEKARTEVADSLAKEKDKEKKHKKEKDKEKREGKEKKDKDRKKDKHKDKKDGKEKHKEKKKDKEKSKTSEEKKKEGKNEVKNDGCNGQIGESSHTAEKLRDSKLVEELGKRIQDEATETGSHVFQNFTASVRGNEGSRKLVDETEKRTEGKDKNKSENKHVEHRKAEKQKDSEEHKGIPIDISRNVNNADQRKIEGIRPRENEVDKRIEAKEKLNKDKAVDEGKGRGKGEKHKDRHREEKRSKGKDKAMVNEKTKEEKVKDHDNHKLHKEHEKLKESGKVEHIGKTLDIKSLHPLKDNEKSPYSEINIKKRKEFEANGFIHENELRPNKILRSASTLLPSKNGRKLESSNVTVIPNFNRQGLNDGRKLETKKDLKVDGNVSVIHNLHRLGPNDGRKVETNKAHKFDGNATIVHSFNRQGSNDGRKVETMKDHKVDGKTEPSSVIPRPSVSIEASENGEASTRPPHPDSKYLSQILSIPKMEECSDFDDQEWLFGSNSLQSKPKAAACSASKTPQVWAEALQIDSADVYALPYVLPY